MLNTNIYDDGHTLTQTTKVQFYYFASKRNNLLVNHIT